MFVLYDNLLTLISYQDDAIILNVKEFHHLQIFLIHHLFLIILIMVNVIYLSHLLLQYLIFIAIEPLLKFLLVAHFLDFALYLIDF
jgi:hypothetical protein